MTNIILINLTVISIFTAIYCVIYRKKYDSQIEEKNRDIQREYNKLQQIYQNLQCDYSELTGKHNKITFAIKEKEKDLLNMQNILDGQKEMSEKAFNSFWENLENDYKAKEKEYDNLIKTLQDSYGLIQMDLLKEAEDLKKELNKLKATKTAILEAQKREQEIKEKLAFYCLTPTQSDLDDVKKLERIKPDLHNPRILSMLIWSTYFQKPMTTLCNNVLGTSTVTGIYKITNVNTSACYIGQAVDVAKRWKEHAKCGLDIDTPAGNKLYKAIKRDGIWNFSWELLEKCSKEELNEKEKYYINLYQSYEFGYNLNAGIGNKTL